MIKLILSTVFLLVSRISFSCTESIRNSKEENFKKNVQHLVSDQLAVKETFLLFLKNKRNSIAMFVD